MLKTDRYSRGKKPKKSQKKIKSFAKNQFNYPNEFQFHFPSEKPIKVSWSSSCLSNSAVELFWGVNASEIQKFSFNCWIEFRVS